MTYVKDNIYSHRLFTVCAAMVLLLLTACGSDGPGVTRNPDLTAGDDDSFIYEGTDPVSDTVQRYRVELWDEIRQTARCGQCHSEEGGTEPKFARIDDINSAYTAVRPLVDLASPEDSLMVIKLRGGHTCWRGAADICADLLLKMITDWSGASGGKANVVELKAPLPKSPAQSKSFPATSASFAANVYTPYLKPYCADCHRDNAPTPQSPFFASDNVDEAYTAAMSKISLDTPNVSRLVVRLRDEFHNCWSDCASDIVTSDSALMLAGINNFAAGISLTQVDPDHVVSKAMSLFDGIVSSSGGRNEDSLIALFQFKIGTVAYDTSGVDKPMDLNLDGDYEWVGGWGINLINGRAQAEANQSEKLSRLITATGEYSIEAWVAPNNVTQEGPARIISYSGGENSRNFMLGQTQYNYNVHHRSSVSDANGEPALSTIDDDQILQATLQHVVVTFNSSTGRKLYVNGVLVAQEADLMSQQGIGSMNNWDNSFAFVLGNETIDKYPFKGVIRLVAIYNKAIPEAQIAQNFEANVGQRYYVMFNVSDVTAINEGYVVFEVSQFDSYSYLFDQPFFISLDANADYSAIPLEGIHIGINGKRAVTGQSFNNIKTSLSRASADENGRQSLSTQGTIIALEKGVSADEFYLIFDKLADQSFPIVDAEPVVTVPAVSTVEQSDIGIKTFDEINLSMARVTGVDVTNADVVETFEKLKQQLPSTTNIATFLTSQQIGITQLAIEYCSVLINDTTARAAYFPGLSFTAGSNNVFNDVDLLLDPLINRIVVNKVSGNSLISEPTDMQIKTDLNALIAKLTTCEGTDDCAPDKTIKVAKATCTTVLASAIGLFQ